MSDTTATMADKPEWYKGYFYPEWHRVVRADHIRRTACGTWTVFAGARTVDHPPAGAPICSACERAEGSGATKAQRHEEKQGV